MKPSQKLFQYSTDTRVHTHIRRNTNRTIATTIHALSLIKYLVEK